MTEFQHALLGMTIVMILWMTFGRKLLRSPKDELAWEEWKNMFRRN